MKYLFINTSTKKLVISIIVDNEIKYDYTDDNSSDLSSRIMPIIDEAFKSTNLKPEDIDTIFVTNGPGSFTGIRIGLTIAKVMAWGLKIKVVHISSLELMASVDTDKAFIAPLIDARRDYVFAGLYDKDLNLIIPDKHILLSEFKSLVKDKDLVYVSHDEFDFEVINDSYNILKVINKHVNDEGVNPHILNPNYLKLTEAEEKLKEK